MDAALLRLIQSSSCEDDGAGNQMANAIRAMNLDELAELDRAIEIPDDPDEVESLRDLRMAAIVYAHERRVELFTEEICADPARSGFDLEARMKQLFPRFWLIQPLAEALKKAAERRNGQVPANLYAMAGRAFWAAGSGGWDDEETRESEDEMGVVPGFDGPN